MAAVASKTIRASEGPERKLPKVGIAVTCLAVVGASSGIRLCKASEFAFLATEIDMALPTGQFVVRRVEGEAAARMQLRVDGRLGTAEGFMLRRMAVAARVVLGEVELRGNGGEKLGGVRRRVTLSTRANFVRMGGILRTRCQQLGDRVGRLLVMALVAGRTGVGAR